MGVLSFVLTALAVASIRSCDALHEPRALSAQNTSLQIFHHRGFHNSIVLGNYLYIDGGEITYWNGKGSGEQIGNPQSNDEYGDMVTLPDLSSSWTNSNVLLNPIEKQSPVVNNEALWLDASGEKIYAYGGGISMGLNGWYNKDPPSNALWQFEPSGESGSWSQTSIPQSSNFSTLSRVTSSSYAYGNGLGFALGGQELYTTTHDGFDSYYDITLVPNLVMYNMTSQDWYNISAADYSYFGFASNGAAQFVPSFGPAGVLMVFGGWTTRDEQYVPFDLVSMFDPVSQQWQDQLTTGDIPQQTANLCVVGVEGDEGTYEIFTYGGRIEGDIDRTVENGVVHVLSLPSFHWHKQAAPPEFGRFMHSCNVIGKRQMVVVGGITMKSGTDPKSFQVDGGEPDPWDQGFGIFDLSDMEWKSSYDASAKSYVTPSSVKTHIKNNGAYPSTWSNSAVEEWFKQPGSSSSSSSPSPSGTDSGNSINSNDTTESGSSNTGAIAGGVVGGVLGAALVGGLMFFLWRRKQRSKHYKQAYYQDEAKMHSIPVLETEGEGHHHEMAGSPGGVELPWQGKPAEAPGHSREIHELDSRDYR